MAKTWTQKLTEKKVPNLQVMQKPMAGVPAGRVLLMPTPWVLKAVMDEIPKGQQISLNELRERLAKAHNSDVACPLSTSAAARVVAEAAWEEIQAGHPPDQVTPFWRVIDPGSSLAKKLTCGSEFLEAMRQQEQL